MREIKFRGMLANGGWVFGLLSVSPGKDSGRPEKGHYISNGAGMPWAYQVRPETVDQFTGLKDKNGKEIYEGDIIRWCRQQGYHTARRGDVDTIDYYHSNQYCGFGINERSSLTDKKAKECEVIGNIHDNPELLEGEGKA